MHNFLEAPLPCKKAVRIKEFMPTTQRNSLMDFRSEVESFDEDKLELLQLLREAPK
jgi:hypothetical protein